MVFQRNAFSSVPSRFDAAAPSDSFDSRSCRTGIPLRPIPLLVRAVIAAGIASTSVAVGAASIPIPDLSYGGAGDGIARIQATGIPANNGSAKHAVVLADGRLVTANAAWNDTGNTARQLVLARLHANGLPDLSFGPQHDGLYRTAFSDGGGFVGNYNDVAQTAEGKLVYVGHGTPASMIVGRLDADGVPDTSFAGSGRRLIGATALVDGATDSVLTTVLPMANGKTLAVGFAVVYTSATTYNVFSCAIRLLADGATDTSFGSSGRTCIAPTLSSAPSSLSYAATVLSDGRILLAGASQHSGGSAADMSVARLDGNGTLDTSFGPNHDGWAFAAFDQGGTLSDAAEALAVDAAGRIVLAGYFDNVSGGDIGVARLLADGQTDVSFGTQGRVQLSLDPGVVHFNQAHSVAVLSNGRILVGASTTGRAGIAIALTPSGSLDPFFGNGGIYYQAGPASAGVATERQVLFGDYLYLVGYSTNAASHFDIAAARVVIPLFADGFEAP